MQTNRVAADFGGTLRWLRVEDFSDSLERDKRYFDLHEMRACFLTRHGRMEMNANNVPVAVFSVTYDAASIPAVEEATEKEVPSGEVG